MKTGKDGNREKKWARVTMTDRNKKKKNDILIDSELDRTFETALPVERMRNRGH